MRPCPYFVHLKTLLFSDPRSYCPQVGDGLQRFQWTGSSWTCDGSPTQDSPDNARSTHSLAVGFPVVVLPAHESENDATAHQSVELQPSWTSFRREGAGFQGWPEQEHSSVGGQQRQQQQQQKGEEQGLLLDASAVVGLPAGQQLTGGVGDEQVSGGDT